MKLDRRFVLAASAVALALAVAVPAIGADPSPGAGGTGSPEPSERPGKPNRPDKAGRPDKGPEIAASLRGTVREATDDAGHTIYTVEVDGTTWELSAGPRWYWGDDHPLAAFVGRSVELAGSHREGESELDVETVDGDPIRAAGKPPWAGGPWVVGERHPGWKPWKAEHKPGHGRDGAPGQNRDRAPKAPEDPAG